MTSYPTLIIVDDQGTVLVRQVGLEVEKVARWLEVQALALRDEKELVAHVASRPDDVEALWLLVRRAQARSDAAAARGWLAKIEAADRSESREDAAQAGWMRIDSELEEKLRAQVRTLAGEYLRRYPAHGDRALKALAAAGLDKKALDAEMARVVAATNEPGDLNNLAYVGLSLGALDGALAAADKQVSLIPEDAGALDTLAEVLSYRGERARAAEVAARAVASAKDPGLAEDLRKNMKRFESGGPSPDVQPPGAMASPLVPVPKPAAVAMTPEAAARRLYQKKAGAVAAACRAAAQKGRLDEVYVRVHLGDARVDKVEVLEPAASPALRRCLDKAVRAIAVPAEQKATRVTLAFPLGA